MKELFQNNQPEKKGGFKRIYPYQQSVPCNDPEHNPPGFIHLENGVYEYTCPKCGKVQIVNVNKPTF